MSSQCEPWTQHTIASSKFRRLTVEWTRPRLLQSAISSYHPEPEGTPRLAYSCGTLTTIFVPVSRDGLCESYLSALFPLLENKQGLAATTHLELLKGFPHPQPLISPLQYCGLEFFQYYVPELAYPFLCSQYS
jgi:hypothetical protein